MHACVYVRVYKCVGVIDTRIYKSYSTQNRSLQRTQRKRKAFHARTSLFISLFCQLHKSVNLENKKKIIFAGWRLRSGRTPGPPGKTYLRSTEPGRFCPRRFAACTAAFSCMQNSRDLTRETLILIYLLFLLTM